MTLNEAAEPTLATAQPDKAVAQVRLAASEVEQKSVQFNIRVPVRLLDAVKQRAKAEGISYTNFVRQVLEQMVAATPT